MGNRRMSLGRMEALLEQVDRDLNLANSTLTDCTITTSAAATFSGQMTNTGPISHAASAVPDYGNKVTIAAATQTIAYATHQGRPVVQTQACVFTLPAVADVKGDIWIINGAPDGTLMTISPDANDKFVWDIAGAAGTNNKDIINTAATAKKGDYVKLRYASADGWAIKEFGGVWADQA